MRYKSHMDYYIWNDELPNVGSETLCCTQTENYRDGYSGLCRGHPDSYLPVPDNSSQTRPCYEIAGQLQIIFGGSIGPHLSSAFPIGSSQTRTWHSVHIHKSSYH